MNIIRALGLLILLAIYNPVNAQFTDYKTYDDFQKGLIDQLEDDQTYVINFWATWCRPCVQELPYFDSLSRDENLDIKVILVSLDFDHQIDSKFKPFLKKRDLHPDVVLLRDGNYNAWIDKVSPTWSGAIPATLFIKGSRSLFKEKQYHSKEEILQEIHQLN